MDNKLVDIKKILFKPENRLRLFVVIGIIGVLLIVGSEMLPSNGSGKASTDAVDYTEYISSLEQRTEQILSSISGAGKCRVMLTIADTNESIYAKNLQESGGNGNYSTSSEYVLYDGADGDTPVLVKQTFPQIQGIVVVCQGADDKIVREDIISAVSALFNVPTNKITVTKLKG